MEHDKYHDDPIRDLKRQLAIKDAIIGDLKRVSRWSAERAAEAYAEMAVLRSRIAAFASNRREPRPDAASLSLAAMLAAARADLAAVPR